MKLAVSVLRNREDAEDEVQKRVMESFRTFKALPTRL